MKTTLTFVFVLFSVTAFAQDKEVLQKSADLKIDLAQPLFIVDGIPTSQFDFNLINPGKIEKMEVVKAEVATLVYGDRARNGAIIVTTKKAKEKSGNRQ